MPSATNLSVNMTISTGCWVDFDLIVPPSCPVSCPLASAKLPSTRAELNRQWNTQNSRQPNPVHEPLLIVTLFLFPHMSHVILPKQYCVLKANEWETWIGGTCGRSLIDFDGGGDDDDLAEIESNHLAKYCSPRQWRDS